MVGQLLANAPSQAGTLTKSGPGTLTLTNANIYSGGTRVSAGTLLVTNGVGSGTGTGVVNINNGGALGGTGTIAGAVTNNAGGILAPGVSGSGTLTLNNYLTLVSGSTNTFAVNGTTPANTKVALAATASVTYGGVLNIATNGTFTLGQTFTLFSGAGATNASNFASIAGSPGAGLVFSFTNGVLSVGSLVLPKPVINTVTASGGNLILQGTNGASSGTYSVLTATNLALPLASWTTNSTGMFTPGGTFSNAIPVATQGQRFFLIKQP
jgi:autotransporter-associated beta strand protein